MGGLCVGRGTVTLAAVAVRLGHGNVGLDRNLQKDVIFMLKNCCFVVALLAIGVCQGSAQVKKTPSGYTIRANYRKGQVILYDIVNTSPALPEPTVVHLRWDVVEVTNGTARIKVTVKGVKSGPKPFEMVVDRQNRATGGDAFGSSYPDGSIKVGAVWKAKLPLNLGALASKSNQETATFTFKGLKTVAGKQYAEMAVKIDGQASGTGSQLVSVSDGVMAATDMKLSLTFGTASATLVTSLRRR